MILSGAFEHFGTLKSVTSKMLAISALCVHLLEKISTKMTHRISNNLDLNKESWLQKKVVNIKTDLRSHQERIYQKIQQILLDKFFYQTPPHPK